MAVVVGQSVSASLCKSHPQQTVSSNPLLRVREAGQVNRAQWPARLALRLLREKHPQTLRSITRRSEVKRKRQKKALCLALIAGRFAGQVGVN